jgi:hypothetical protein
MKRWEEEVIQAAEAGEREFGLLDAHRQCNYLLPDCSIGLMTSRRAKT